MCYNSTKLEARQTYLLAQIGHSTAVKMENNRHNIIHLLCEIYQEIYGSKITMANLNELASDLSQLAGRTRPWTGKFLHSLIKGYPGFTTNGQLSQALNILSGRLNGLDKTQAQVKEVTVSAEMISQLKQ